MTNGSGNWDARVLHRESRSGVCSHVSSGPAAGRGMSKRSAVEDAPRWRAAGALDHAFDVAALTLPEWLSTGFWLVVRTTSDSARTTS